MNIFTILEKNMSGPGRKAVAYRILFSLMIVLPVIFVVMFSAVTSYRDTTSDIYEKRYASAQLIESIIHERLVSMVLLAESAASRPKVVENVEKGDWDAAISYAEYLPKQYDYIDSMRLADISGTVRAGVGSYKELIGKNLSYRDWYQGVSKNWEPYVSGIFRRLSEPGINVITVAVPIREIPLPGVPDDNRNHKDNEIIGILTLQIRPEVLIGWLREIQVGSNTSSYLVDKNRNLIAHTEIDTTEKIYDFSSLPAVRMLHENSTGINNFYYSDTDENKLTAYIKCSQHGWGLVVEEPAKSAFALRVSNMSTQLPVYILFVLLSFAITLLLLRYMARIRDAWAISQKLAHIIENSEDAIYSRDLNDNVITWNKGAEKIYGYCAEEVIGKSFLKMVPVNIRGNYNKIFESLKSGASVKNKTVRRIRKDGKHIFVSFTSSPVMDIHGNIAGISSIAHDITKQINSDRLLKEKSRQLEQLNAELEAFSYSVSHDLRGPLRGIDGFSSALVEDYSEKLDPQAKDYIARIRKASQKMGDLIEDLLMLSKVARNEIKFKNINLSIMVQKIAGNLSSTHYLSKDTLKTNFTEFLIEPGINVLADENLIEIMLYNLLENAFKFSKIREKPVVEFGKFIRNGERIIFVKDNGVGFDMRYVEKVFNPFQRLHLEKEFPGTGIGLATVKRIVNRHKGKIWIESSIGAGTAVYFIIPEKRKTKSL